MAIFGKTEYEKQFETLTPDEKHIVISTSLSIEDINYYEEMICRKLTTKELKIVALLSNNGVKLDRYFLNPYVSHE